jgi:hypothetical protein
LSTLSLATGERAKGADRTLMNLLAMKVVLTAIKTMFVIEAIELMGREGMELSIIHLYKK